MLKSKNRVSIVIGPPESGNPSIDSDTKENPDYLNDEELSFQPGRELEIEDSKDEDYDGKRSPTEISCHNEPKWQKLLT